VWSPTRPGGIGAYAHAKGTFTGKSGNAADTKTAVTVK
jgi:hypothetical protein